MPCSGLNAAVSMPHLDLTSIDNPLESDSAESGDFADETSFREEEVIQSDSQPHGPTSPEDMSKISTLN